MRTENQTHPRRARAESDAATDRMCVARVLFCAGQLREAEALARDELASQSDAAPALHLLSRIYHAEGRLTETIDCWRRARKAEPDRHRFGSRAPFDSGAGADSLAALELAWLQRRMSQLTPADAALSGLAFERELHARLSHREGPTPDPDEWLQEPTATDVVRALLQRYIPLDALPKVNVGARERAELEAEVRRLPTVVERSRCRAFVAFVDGDVARCRRALTRVSRSRFAHWRDFASLADLARMEGRFEDAFQYDIESVRRSDRPEPVLWRRIAGAVRRGADPAPVRELLAPERRAEEVLAACLADARDAPANRSLWESLAVLESLAGRTEAARVHRKKAAALASASAGLPEPGRVLLAAVYALDGEPRGLVHEIHATRSRVPMGGVVPPGLAILGNVSPELFALAHRVLVNARGFVRAWWPHLAVDADGFLYTLKVTKDDEPSSGASAGLPLAIAFVSAISGRPVPEGVAFSGAISCDSDAHVRVRRIGDADTKVEGALHRGLPAVVLPEENRPDIERSDRLPRSRAREITRFVSTLREAVELLWGRSAWDW